MNTYKIGDKVSIREQGELYPAVIVGIHDDRIWINYLGEYEGGDYDDVKFDSHCVEPYQPPAEKLESKLETMIHNANERIGRLESKEGKLSKTDVQYIMQNISALRKRIEVLEVDYLHSVEARLNILEKQL